jgi:hypothetical protein
MTANAYSMGGGTTVIDLSTLATETYGTNARRNMNGIMNLWGGDATGDGVVVYTGASNDRTAVLNAVGPATYLTPLSGYHGTDVTMDGLVNYTSSGSDRTYILNTVGATTVLNSVGQQLP